LELWVVGGNDGKPNPFGKDEKEIEKKSEYKTKAALRKVVEQSYDFVIASVAEIDETKLPEQITFFNSKVTRLFCTDYRARSPGPSSRANNDLPSLKGVTPPPEP